MFFDIQFVTDTVPLTYVHEVICSFIFQEALAKSLLFSRNVKTQVSFLSVRPTRCRPYAAVPAAVSMKFASSTSFSDNPPTS